MIFMSPSRQDIIFHDVPDPDGVVRLIKSLKKSRRTEIEKNDKHIFFNVTSLTRDSDR